MNLIFSLLLYINYKILTKYNNFLVKLFFKFTPDKPNKDTLRAIILEKLERNIRKNTLKRSYLLDKIYKYGRIKHDKFEDEGSI